MTLNAAVYIALAELSTAHKVSNKALEIRNTDEYSYINVKCSPPLFSQDVPSIIDWANEFLRKIVIVSCQIISPYISRHKVLLELAGEESLVEGDNVLRREVVGNSVLPSANAFRSSEDSIATAAGPVFFLSQFAIASASRPPEHDENVLLLFNVDGEDGSDDQKADKGH
ncbi:hypothetical protein PRIPAC_73981 [Pristionchus pacificus]|uniref:Uncharacterized protein n=1 Tax=Pristionchus pacificus TaxID=54126 RepID=A0A2A6C8S5_PRIPA|nr:hypothetical protein PRIPAC_73981 [Pristionchus pacificus]|eukprot:PDM74506.1 hypothetical protein PRIPAC_41862 [Pristionchus pacificus]